MKRKGLFLFTTAFYMALGVTSAIAAGIIDDPYYSLPSVIISVFSFITAGLSLLLKKENAWINVAFIILLLFTSSSTGVIISKYTAEIDNNTTYGIEDEFYDLNVLSLDPQTVVIKITISLSNPDIYDVRMNKISLEVTNTLFPELKKESLVLIGNVEWMPFETIKARNHTKISAIITVNETDAVSYLVNKVQGSDRLLLGVKGSIWYEEKGQEKQVNIMGTAFQFLKNNN